MTNPGPMPPERPAFTEAQQRVVTLVINERLNRIRKIRYLWAMSGGFVGGVCGALLAHWL